ncbi:MAG TPA: hypothetical protein VFM74_00430 [Candidatus Limnocylindria bacterium]|nr:hypothetical protein [Candidatus Limnocylindria bacterium]
MTSAHGVLRVPAARPILVLAGAIVALAGVPVLLLPLVDRTAPPPLLSVAPARVAPGGSVALNGVGFRAGSTGRVALDGTAPGLAAYTADAHGNFTARVTLPQSTGAGEHTLVALQSDGSDGKNGSTNGSAIAQTPLSIAPLTAHDLQAALTARGDVLETLAAAISNVTAADGYRYQLHDSDGATMDTLKVIASPAGGYLGVYHSGGPDRFSVKLATSSDLLTWLHITDLDAYASQPTIATLPDGGFLLADEAGGDPSAADGTWLRFRHYPDLAALLSGTSDRLFEAPHTLVPSRRGAEGTPSIESVSFDPDLDHSVIRIGFHYFKDARVDRQALGVLTDFERWTATPDVTADADLIAAGAAGKIGDRDTISADGRQLRLYEGQLRNDDWSSWRVYLYEPATRRVLPLQVRTHGGSSAFANPTLSLLPGPTGRPALVMTLFLPESGAARGETGELIYFKELGG